MRKDERTALDKIKTKQKRKKELVEERKKDGSHGPMRRTIICQAIRHQVMCHE